MQMWKTKPKEPPQAAAASQHALQTTPQTTPKVITFMSMKGGAGKTIGLMALASALVERGHRVGVLEADEVAPITRWRNHAKKKETWNPDIFIHQARAVGDLETVFQSIGKDNVEFLLVDTAGGGSDLNQTLILNSQLVIVPTGLDPTEMDALFETCNYLIDVVDGSAEEIPVVIMLNRTPTREAALPVTHRMALQALIDAGMPVLNSRLPRRQVLADTAASGILKRYYEYCRSAPERRLMAPEVLKAIKDSEALADEVLSLLTSPMEV